MVSGKFITLEGIEGVGKTTAIDTVTSFCENYLNKKVINTREPGGTKLAERFRDLLLEETEEHLTSRAELLLFFAGRAQHISELIEPALQKGYFVISDRFIDATYAYQGGGRGVDLNVIKTLENMVHPNLKPDLTLLLDAPLDVCAKRVNSRKFKDRFEQEQDDFFEKVRNSYLQRANQEPQRIKIVNANQSINGVQKSIENELLKAFNES
jgi:dTMP kinase